MNNLKNVLLINGLSSELQVSYLLIAGVAAWVALMAVLQIRGLKRTSLKY